MEKVAYNESELAKRWGISPKTLQRWRSEGIVRTLVGDESKQREVGLGFLPDQRVHTTPYQQEKL
jgi:transposase-like protein